MKKFLFEFLHNVIAHPLLTVGQLLQMIVVILAVFGMLIAGKKPGVKPPQWLRFCDPLRAAEFFHDWTAKHT